MLYQDVKLFTCTYCFYKFFLWEMIILLPLLYCKRTYYISILSKCWASIVSTFSSSKYISIGKIVFSIVSSKTSHILYMYFRPLFFTLVRLRNLYIPISAPWSHFCIDSIKCCSNLYGNTNSSFVILLNTFSFVLWYYNTISINIRKVIYLWLLLPQL